MSTGVTGNKQSYRQPLSVPSPKVRSEGEMIETFPVQIRINVPNFNHIPLISEPAVPSAGALSMAPERRLEGLQSAKLRFLDCKSRG